MFSLSLSLLALVGSTFSQIVIDNTTMIHYDISYSNNYRFTNSINSNYILDSSNNISQCQHDCAFNNDCLGIYENIDDNYCNMLSNLGRVDYVNENSNSYTKIVHHYHPLENHSLEVVVWDSNIFNDLEESHNLTVYLDLNHNGELDSNEPFIETQNNVGFTFDNITEGSYLVRQIVPDYCVQFYPGLNGSFSLFSNNNVGDGYVDKAIRYHHTHKNMTIQCPHGGYVNSISIIQNSNFSFIIGNNTENFISFYPDDSITLVFLDDSIIDMVGTDLYIQLYGNSSTIANVSISHDDNIYEHLGILVSSKSINEYDLNTINYTMSVNYIKLDFIGNNIEDPLNVVTIGIENKSIYLPPFSYNINIPYDGTILFLNDCNYDFSCGMYCDLNLLEDNDFLSCNYGCELFDSKQSCNCSQGLELFDDDFFDSFDMKSSKCEHGCEYALQKHIFPNYTLIANNDGYTTSKIENERCDIKCIDNLITDCNELDECKALSLSDTNNELYGNLFNNYEHRYNKGSQFIVKNSYFDTTTTTTSGTTTTTTSGTTTTTTSGTTTTTTSGTTTTTTSGTTTTTTSGTTTTTTSGTTTTTTSGTTTTTTSGTTTTTTSGTTTTTTSGTSTTTLNYDTINDYPFRLSKNNKIIIAVVVCCCSIIVIILSVIFIKINKPKQQPNHSFSVQNPVYDESIEQNQEQTNYQDLKVNYNVDNNNEYLVISET